MRSISFLLIFNLLLTFGCSSKDNTGSNSAAPAKKEEKKTDEQNPDNPDKPEKPTTPKEEVKPAQIPFVDQFLADIDQEILYSSATPKDKTFVVGSLKRMKVLVALVEKDKTKKEYTHEFYSLYKRLTFVDKTAFDKERFEELYAFLEQEVYKLAKIQGVKFEDLSWEMYQHSFELDLSPYLVISSSVDSSSWHFYKVESIGKTYARIFSNKKESSSWLISERLSLEKVDRAILKVKQTVTPKTMKWESASIKISEDFVKDPSQATWESYSVKPAKSSTRSWFDFETQIDLSSFLGKKIVIAFHYSNPDGSETGVWEIGEVTIKGAGEKIDKEVLEPQEEDHEN